MVSNQLKEWVRIAKEKGASDLHLEGGSPVVLRVRGELVAQGEFLTPDSLQQMARDLLRPEQWQEFLHQHSFDFSETIGGVRCRFNVYHSLRGVCFAIRLLSSFQSNLRDCNLMPDLQRLIESRSGLVIISGPTGSGKSTTLAALIDEINARSRKHIITVESPIEYFFANKKSYIRQREVPTHTPNFEQALTDSMRENPDVLVISEMRTPEVMRLTLNAAETGHLVLATMHSATCAEALSRIAQSFAPEIQGAVRAQIADSLVGVVCQRLTYLPQFQLRIPQCEILTANTAAKATIRAGQFSQIQSVIQSGGEDGMYSFERYQKWIDSKRDWVKPSQATAAVVSSGGSGSVGAVGVGAMGSALEVPRGVPPALKKSPGVGGGAKPNEKPVDNRIEIGGAVDDLEELAKRISDEDE